MKNYLLSLILIILSALFDSYAAFIVKAKFNELGAIDYSSLSNFLDYLSKFLKSPLLLTAVIAFVSAPGLWFLALNKVQLSVGYPTLVCFHLLFILFFGVFFLKEPLSFQKMIGVALVFLSVYFLNT